MSERTRLRNLYWNMMSRCHDPRHKSFHRYGGRGITVCVKWRGHMDVFIAWAVANGSRPGLIFDRRNNDRGYSPSNCRFVDRKTSRANTSFSPLPSLAQYRRYKNEGEREKTSKGIARSWQKPSRRKKQTVSLKRAWANPERMERGRERQRLLWADPVWRARTSAAIRRGKRGVVTKDYEVVR